MIPSLEELAESTTAAIRAIAKPSLRRVINATGVILHTGLGRAVLPAGAWQAVFPHAWSHSSLEVDLTTGERGSRSGHIEPLLCKLTGAEAALAVNNDAGAVLLALAALARGREVIVSRGELVEIGGGFRIPEVMMESSAILHEVGATNKTRLRDYECAVGPNTAAILKVHPSNYRIVGFTETTGIAELAGLARDHGIPLLDDLGSGALVDIGHSEPTVQERLAQGADLVMFSGDKLMGGPQAGLIVGRKDLVHKLAAHPLYRALRCGKVTLGLLEGTLRVYRAGLAWEKIPTLQALALTPDVLKQRAEDLAARLAELEGVQASVVESVCRVGAGALPCEDLPSFAVAVEVAGLAPNTLASELRMGEPPILAHVTDDTVLLEVQTLRGTRETRWITQSIARIVGMEEKSGPETEG